MLLIFYTYMSLFFLVYPKLLHIVSTKPSSFGFDKLPSLLGKIDLLFL